MATGPVDFLELLRLKTLFGLPSQYGGAVGSMPNPAEFSENYAPQKNSIPPADFGPTDITVPQMESTTPNVRGIGQAMANYQPETAATERLNKMLGEYPQYETPSKMRAVLAALSSFGPGGHETGMQVLNEPYLRKMNDWKTQIGPVQRAAELERLTNTNERTAAFQAGNQQLTAQRDADKDEIARGRLNLMMSEFEKLKMKQSGDMERLMQMGANAQQLENLRAQHAQALKEMEMSVRKEIAELRQSNATDVFGQPTNIVDPNDPTKLISVVTNKQGVARPITMEGGGPAGALANKAPGKYIQPVNIEAIQAKAQETLDVVHQMFDPKAGKVKPEYREIIGTSRLGFRHYLPGDWGTRGQNATYNQLRALLIVDLISEMKNQSKTGATGFGQLSRPELIVLDSAASQLDPFMKEEAFDAAMKTIEEKLKKILLPADGNNPTITPVMPTAADMLEQRRKLRGGG